MAYLRSSICIAAILCAFIVMPTSGKRDGLRNTPTTNNALDDAQEEVFFSMPLTTMVKGNDDTDKPLREVDAMALGIVKQFNEGGIDIDLPEVMEVLSSDMAYEWGKDYYIICTHLLYYFLPEGDKADKLVDLICGEEIVAADYVGGGTQFAPSYPSYRSTGWNFTPSKDILVTELGFYDIDSSGLGNDHNVGIFRMDNQGVAIVSTIVSGSTAAVVDGTVGRTFFEPVSPTTLTAGVMYYIVTDYFSVDGVVFGTGSVLYNSDFVYNGVMLPTDLSNDIFSTALALNPYGTPQPGNLGPNFKYVHFG